jgi:beta-galactosidase
MERDVEGKVTLTSSRAGAQILYTVGKGKKVQTYVRPFSLREGGVVTAWDAAEPSITSQATWAKIDRIPTRVVFASSVEHGEGDAEHLTDGDPNTYWHTMYSVTVANYPHWVDFDCGAAKLIKGFVYLPRQDSGNGNIKGYKIQLSQDGRTWSDAVAEGTFANNRQEKRISLRTAVRARYVRFTALSSQDGQDFATGAEFSILAD